MEPTKEDCQKCPNKDDKHQMNCIECCPVREYDFFELKERHRTKVNNLAEDIKTGVEVITELNYEINKLKEKNGGT